MTTPAIASFDLATPRRPTTDDFNGCAKEDEEGWVPDPRTQPNAAEWNYVDFLLLALGRVTALAKISVTSGTTPIVNGVISARSAFTISSITVTRVSAGIVQLTWAANTFPTPDVKPEAFLNGTVSGMITCSSLTNGVQVNTFDATGAAADRDFTVAVN